MEREREQRLSKKVRNETDFFSRHVPSIGGFSVWGFSLPPKFDVEALFHLSGDGEGMSRDRTPVQQKMFEHVFGEAEYGGGGSVAPGADAVSPMGSAAAVRSRTFFREGGEKSWRLVAAAVEKWAMLTFLSGPNVAGVEERSGAASGGSGHRPSVRGQLMVQSARWDYDLDGKIGAMVEAWGGQITSVKRGERGRAWQGY